MRVNVSSWIDREKLRVRARLLGASFALLLFVRADAAAADRSCRAAPAVAPSESLDSMLTAADALTSPLDRPLARAIYLAILARDPEDEEAAVGLARADAADACYALAERGYRDVLARSSGNVDARAGLADVLVWTDRLGEAEKVLDEGLRYAPLSPALLSRRGRVAYYRGDPQEARRYLDEAARVSPLDPEVGETRSRLHMGQVRMGQRVQLFPRGYDDLFTTDVSVVSRLRRIRVELGATVMARSGAERATRSGSIPTTVLDGRPTAGAYYHFQNGAWAGGSLGISAPALALPRYSFALSGFLPFNRVFSGHLTTAYWMYRDARDVTILSPALSMAVSDTIDVTARYWLTSVIARGSPEETKVAHVHSAGLRLGWRPISRLSLGLDYTYGVQLERNPTATELVNLRSHIVSLLVLFLVTKSFGVDAALSVERRLSLHAGPDVYGPAAEAGIFVRW